MKKLFACLLALVMALSLTACWSGQPKTAGELLERNITAQSENNFNVSGYFSMALNVDAEGVSIELPIDVAIDFDVYSDMAHGTMDLSGSILGADLSDTYEMYADAESVYSTAASDDGVWTVSDANASDIDFNSMISNLTADDVFDDADMSYDKSTKTYTVAMKAEKLLDQELFGELFDLSGLLEDESMVDDIEDVFGECPVTYLFDSDYHLTKLSIADMSYEGEIEQDGDISLAVNVTVNIELNISKYGEIEEIIIPDEILGNAVLEEDLELDPTDGNEEFLVYPAGGVLGLAGAGDSAGTLTASIIGCYNGTLLIPNTYSADLFEDKFQITNGEGEYSFVVFDSIDGDTVLYLYDRDRTGLTENLANGIYGYTIHVYDLHGNKNALPNFSFGGLTFGASYEDVMAVYGDGPDKNYYDNTSGYWSLAYDVDEAVGTGEDCDFYIYGNEYGVYEVSLIDWDL